MLWEELKKAALLGLARYPLSEEVLAALDELGVNVGQEDADVLLEAAATLHGMQRAGQVLERHPEPLPEPVATDDDAVLDPATVRLLQPVFEGEYKAALPEVLALMRTHDKRLPGEILPALFARLRDQPAELEALRPLWGARGEWWLQQHPQYCLFARTPPPESWTDENPAARLRFLKYLRRYNADEGLNLLAASWDKLPKEEKLTLLDGLRINPSGADLPFLRSLATERAVTLRRRAAQLRLLAGDVELTARFEQRFREQLSTTGSTNGPVVVFTPPDTPDESAYADGLISRAGAKKWTVDYLEALLQGVPVDDWAPLIGVNEKELPGALLRSDWWGSLFPAYLNALSGTADAERIETLWRMALNNEEQTIRNYGQPLAALAPHLPAGRADALLLHFAQAHQQLIRDELFWQLLLNSPHEWSNNLSLAVLKPFQRHLRNDDFRMPHLPAYRQLLRTAGYRIDPALLPTIEQGWYTFGATYGQWEQDIEAMQRVLLFRGRLRKALKS